MAVYRLGSKIPCLADTTYVADNATVIGDVTLGERASIWFHAVVRGDNAAIRIGAGSNVQDGAVLHGAPGRVLTIGAGVTVGHGAKLHGCTIGDNSLIGIDTIVLDGVYVGQESLVAAGSVLPPGKEYPARHLIVGSPATAKRPLSEKELFCLRDNALRYVRDAEAYRHELERVE